MSLLTLLTLSIAAALPAAAVSNDAFPGTQVAWATVGDATYGVLLSAEGGYQIVSERLAALPADGQVPGFDFGRECDAVAALVSAFEREAQLLDA